MVVSTAPSNSSIPDAAAAAAACADVMVEGSRIIEAESGPVHTSAPGKEVEWERKAGWDEVLAVVGLRA